MKKPIKVCSLVVTGRDGFVAKCGRVVSRKQAQTPGEAGMTAWASLVTCQECNQ